MSGLYLLYKNTMKQFNYSFGVFTNAISIITGMMLATPLNKYCITKDAIVKFGTARISISVCLAFNERLGTLTKKGVTLNKWINLEPNHSQETIDNYKLTLDLLTEVYSKLK